MSTINQLYSAMSVNLGDQIPIFTTNSQTTRRFTLAQFVDFMQQNLSLPNYRMTTQYAAPAASGFSVQILNTGADVHLILTPVAPYAAGTIVLPATPVDAQQVLINTTQAISALTFSLNGANTLIGVPGSLEQNDTVTLAFDAPGRIWYMVDRSVPVPVTPSAVQTLSNKTFVAPVLGTPASGNLANCTGYPGAQLTGFAAGILTFLTTPTSANLAAAVTDETGSGALVFATSPSLVTPALGTPSAANLANATNLPVGSIAGTAAGILTFLQTPSSANLAAALTDEQGTGNVVFSNSPTLTAATINQFARGAPVIKTGNFTVAGTENWIILNGSGTITITLPDPTTCIGREIMVKNVTAFGAVGSVANIQPLNSLTPGTNILPPTAGSSATLVSGGTNWVIMA